MSIRPFALLACWLACHPVCHALAPENDPAPAKRAPSPFGTAAFHEDGLAEMCYYDAADTIYGKSRSYTRVHLVNREWMDEAAGVKTEQDLDRHLPVLKFNVLEEIPTENYDYRYQTTVFVERSSLSSRKMVVSSQEWCGTTFKLLRWGEQLVVRSFSYFPGEGDREWTLPAATVAYEALPLLARDAVSRGGASPVAISLLAPLRSNKQPAIETKPATLALGERRDVKTRAGKFAVRRVTLAWEGPEAWFDVEDQAPWRLVAYRMGDAAGELRHVERRPYWDRESKSGFYRQGEAP